LDDRQKENSTRGTAIAATVAALGLLFVVLIWGPGRVDHVESNSGPSGTPGSTIKSNAPPPAVPRWRKTGCAQKHNEMLADHLTVTFTESAAVSSERFALS
jgi:hypothetical protein